MNALEGTPRPVYGNGQQFRDWLHVEDYARALYKVVTEGAIGETYNIGGHNEKTNLGVMDSFCEILDELGLRSVSPRDSVSRDNMGSYTEFIIYVADRPGYDQRNAIGASEIQIDLFWVPLEIFEAGLCKTVQWDLNNLDWCQHIQDGSYQRQRLGLVDKQKGTTA